MDGLTATRLIREHELSQPGKMRVPIIAMTAFVDKQRCLDAGMDDFLFKPVLLEPLKDTLARWLNKKVVLDLGSKSEPAQRLQQIQQNREKSSLRERIDRLRDKYKS